MGVQRPVPAVGGGAGGRARRPHHSYRPGHRRHEPVLGARQRAGNGRSYRSGDERRAVPARPWRWLRAVPGLGRDHPCAATGNDQVGAGRAARAARPRGRGPCAAARLVRPAERAQVPAVPPGSGVHRRDGPEDAGDGRPARRWRAAAALPARALRDRTPARTSWPCAQQSPVRLPGVLLGLPVRRPGDRQDRTSGRNWPTTVRRSLRRCWPQPACSPRTSLRPPG